jgi:hypothetical protein
MWSPARDPADFVGNQPLVGTAQDDPAGPAIVLEVPSQTRDGVKCLLDSGLLGKRLVLAHVAQHVDLALGEGHHGRSIGVGLGRMAQQKKTPSYRQEEAEDVEERMEAFKLSLSEGAAGLEGLEVLLDPPSEQRR